ncbi:B-cell receptor CD22-like [Corythoichthys intestinalis]|uniref:B-cell receptor CD22-like n=1 Tax=Corythoichthys intestinalis TaxID=161448 RepID=UPI0025A59D09|nr:B-cell receptor CD22-like [Corythoichthys intestinalis]
MTDFALKIFLLFGLLGGSFCEQWATMLPLSVQALSGSCLYIPCTFTILQSQDINLNSTCAAIWRTGTFSFTDVFDSRLTREQSRAKNLLQGNVVGNLLDKNCSTMLEGVTSDRTGSYFFRLECANPLKFNFVGSYVSWDVQDSPPQPTITRSTKVVIEGDALDLKCQAPVRCPTLPPLLTWVPQLGTVTEAVEAEASAVMTFKATYQHHNVRVTCNAIYRRQAGLSELATERSLTLQVFYGPKDTTVSYASPAIADMLLTLTCESNANPQPDYSWYQGDGEQLRQVSPGKQYNIRLREDEPTIYCKARNLLGEQNSSVTIDVQFPPKNTTVLLEPPSPILEGNRVVLLCQSRAKPPIRSFSWSKDGREVELAFNDRLTLNAAQPEHGGLYICTAQNALGTASSNAVLLDVQYPPKNTSVSASPPGSLPDGSAVTLKCNGVANPMVIDVKWYRVNSGVTTSIGSGREITFNVTKLSWDNYYCENQNIHGVQTARPITIDVTFAPEILTSSRCQDVSAGTQCTCISQANPPPSLQWELSTVLVNNSNQRPILEHTLNSFTRRSIIVLQLLDGENIASSLVCISLNEFGSDRLAFNMSLPAPQIDVTVLASSAVGIVVLLILSFLLLLYICRKTKVNSPASNGKASSAADFLVTNKRNGSQVAILSTEAAPDNEQLHYADVNVTRLQAREPGEIRGLSSVTQEYAEIRLYSTEGMDQEREPNPETEPEPKLDPEEEKMADSPFGPEDASQEVASTTETNIENSVFV